MASARLDRTRLAAARLRAADAQPFLALALYALTPVSVPGHGTFSVDEQWRLYIDPERLDEWTISEVAGVLLHEVGHVVRDHGGRARTAGVDESNRRAWNLAADAEINQTISKLTTVSLPQNGVTPQTLHQPEGFLAEWYYAKLLRDGIPGDVPPAECGAGCHGCEEPDVRVEPGDLLPAGLREVEAVLLRRRIAEEVLRQRGSQPGSVPGEWERWAEAVLEPTIDWRKLLAAAIRSGVANVNGAADYSYSRPSRRRVPHVVLPSMVRPLPRVAVVIDTSASMSDDHLGRAWSEVQACLRHLGVRRDLLHVYAADNDVHRITSPYGRTVSLQGGGGTDMRVGIDTALSARSTPDLIVVLTDGLTPWPDRAPRRRVIVGLLEGAWKPADPPVWATCVRIPRDTPP